MTADLVGSRRAEARADLQIHVEAALASTNRAFRRHIEVPFSVTLGDEWQGLLRTPDSALDADFAIRRLLAPARVSTGIGIGAVATARRARTGAMDGECFQRSRDALIAAKRRRHGASILLSGEPAVDRPANAILRLLEAVARGWTDRQREAVLAYLDHRTELRAATALGVTQPTLHKSLDASQGKEYLAARSELLEFLRGAWSGSEPVGGNPR